MPPLSGSIESVNADLPHALPTAVPHDDRPLWKRALPFIVAVALVALLAYRLDLQKVVRHLGSVNYPGFLAFVVVFMILLLGTDSVATSFVYRKTICPQISTREFFLVRGASYLPSLLNHHVGQVWLTWYLSKAYRAPLWRVAGATLLVYATTFASLFVFAALSLPFERPTWLVAALVIAAVAGVSYLITIRLAPPFLARRQVLAPLFEVGVRGHLQALLVRMPHVFVLFLGTWLPFYFFGVRIPPGAALAYVPILMFIVALPVTPQGVGTRDWFSLHYFSQFASGTPADQESAVAAATLTFAAALSLVLAVGSFLLMHRALRILSDNRQA